MGKVKNKVPESWKPTIQHDAFLSKNKKRKEKRLAQKLTVQKIDTGDFIPVKKSALTPFNKSKTDEKKPNLISKFKKENALSTSLPIKGNKKEKLDKPNNSFNMISTNGETKKITGILSNANTPKTKKKERVTFVDIKKKGKKFLDDEAKDGEEPINDKMVKPYEKKNNKKKIQADSSDEEDNSSVDAEDYFDMEASEGDETDEEDEDDGTDTGDSDDFSDEDTNISNFIHDESDSDEDEDEDELEVENEDDDDSEGGEDDSESGDEDESEDESESEDETPKKTKLVAKTNVSKVENLKQKNISDKAKTSTPVVKEKVAKTETPAKTKTVKVEQNGFKEMSQEKNATPAKMKAVKVEQNGVNEVKQEKNAKKTVKEEPNKTKAGKEETNKTKPDKVEKNETEKVEFHKPSEFCGFIGKLPSSVTEEEIKVALKTKINLSNLLTIRMLRVRKSKTHNNAWVYVNSSENLEKILNQEYQAGETKFTITRAKGTYELVAFLPRVPEWVTLEQLKEVFEAVLGAGKVTEFKEKKLLAKYQTRNILMYFADAESLKKAVTHNLFRVKDHPIIVREAVEGVEVQVYRAVFAKVPEKAKEEDLKKALEATIGKNTIDNIRFSYRKKSFAFVVFKNEEAQKKALALKEFLFNETKMRVLPYKPRTPMKRGPNEKKEKRPPFKKQKRKLDSSEEANTAQAGKQKKQKLEKTSNETSVDNGVVKKEKVENMVTEETSSPQEQQQNGDSPNKKKRKRNKKKTSTESMTGEVKAVKNPQVMEKKNKSTPKPDSKVSPLKKKIEEKKDNLKKKQNAQQKKNKKNKQSV